MLRLGAVLFVVSLAWFAASQPIDSEEGWVRVQRSAQPARKYVRLGQHVKEPREDDRKSVGDGHQEENEEDEEEAKPQAPKVVPKAPKQPKRRVMAEEEDDVEEHTPRRGGQNQNNSNFPTYANFFPIMFTRSPYGSRRRSSGGDAEEGVNGGLNPDLTAISNSFSTGRGAISSSTATVFGGRAPAMPAAAAERNQYRKSSPSRYRS